MSNFELTEVARRDLRELWEYIARESEHNADLLQDAVLETCRSAASMPGKGHRRTSVEDPRVRFLGVPRYQAYSIAYVVNSQPLKILRIVHGARDVPKLLR